MPGEALKTLRTIHEYSLSEMAKKLGMSASYLSEIENGKKAPPLDLINRFAEIFKTTPSAILFFSEEISKEKRSPNYKKNIRKILLKLLKGIEDAKP